MERREGSGLLLRCRERRAGSPGCDGDGRGTTSKYYVGDTTFFFSALNLLMLQFETKKIIYSTVTIILPSSSPNTTFVCFFPFVSNHAYVIIHVTTIGLEFQAENPSA